MLHLNAPYWLIALLLPALLLWSLRRQTNRPPPQHTSLTHPLADLFDELKLNQPQATKTPWYWLTGIAFITLALSQPQWVDTSSEDTRYGRDIMLVLDVSGSTRAQDFLIEGQVVDRLDMIKHTANNFIAQRQGDRIGVIIFGDDAYTLIPMSPDLSTVKKLVAGLDNNIAGEKTALGDAIALASKRLRDNDQRQRVMIIMTDGSNTTGSIHPLTALDAAKTHNIRIHTIGIGSHRRVAFPKAILEQPELVQMPLDETLLQRLASETGGLYFLGQNNETLKRISHDINTLEQRPHAHPLGATKELYWLPLFIGMLFIFFAVLRQQKINGCYTHD